MGFLLPADLRHHCSQSSYIAGVIYQSILQVGSRRWCICICGPQVLKSCLQNGIIGITCQICGQEIAPNMNSSNMFRKGSRGKMCLQFVWFADCLYIFWCFNNSMWQLKKKHIDRWESVGCFCCTTHTTPIRGCR